METQPSIDMQDTASMIPILPYSRIVGQAQIKLALEIAYVAPQRLGSVLISGQRGTGKSTAVRAFAKMVYKQLPVTLTINAIEDRVVGGWKIDALMRSESTWQTGLLEETVESHRPTIKERWNLFFLVANRLENWQNGGNLPV